MITLNDYLYSGDTVLRILYKYSADLRNDAINRHDPIDMAHSNFLVQMIELLEHNDFLTDQSHRIQEFYKYMAKEYHYLAFTFKGRIKSLIRAEAKYNGNIVEYISDMYHRTGKCPAVSDIRRKLNTIRDLIAYRIVIQVPNCHLTPGEKRDVLETQLLYELANILPDFLEQRGFTAVDSGLDLPADTQLKDSLHPYYRDYIATPKKSGYQALHISFYDNYARCYTEVQLRSKEMDDHAEIGACNHLDYEKQQALNRTSDAMIPSGLCTYYDNALERCRLLHAVDLSTVNVNMFTALPNGMMNDGCGLYRGRLILPFEHLSRFQNDTID